MKTINGKLPKAITETSVFKTYVKEQAEFGLWGYVGHSSRTEATDVIVVTILKGAGYNHEAIATFLVSRAGRHTMDQYDQATVNQFKKMLIDGIEAALSEHNDSKVEALKKQGKNDYSLESQSVWIEAGGFTVYIRKGIVDAGDGIHVEILPGKDAMDKPLAKAFVFNHKLKGKKS